MDLTLNNSDVTVSYIDKNGSKVTKSISVEDFIFAVSNKVLLNTGLLSRGIRQFYATGDIKVVTIEIPPKIRDVLYGEETELIREVPFPGLLFIFKLCKSSVARSWCFAIKEPLSNENIKLFHFPFGNVHSNGDICWGNDNKLDSSYNPSVIGALVTKFLNSPFNNDLWYVGKSSEYVPSNNFEFLNYLSGKQRFPLSYLGEIGTYKNIIKNIM